jgi:hypothetical protein
MSQLDLPFGLPASNDSTSLEAAESLVPHLGRLEAAVLEVIRHRHGATDEEVERATGLLHQTASARRRGLVLHGMVRDSGLTRKTNSGRNAIVWVVSSDAPARQS